MKLSRRSAVASVLASAAAPFVEAAPKKVSKKIAAWPPEASANAPLPRLCLISGSTPAQLRHLQQIGINYAIGGAIGPTPWTEERIRAAMDPYKAGGVQAINFMIGGNDDIIRGGPKRDEQIENIIQSIRAAGRSLCPCCGRSPCR